MAKKELWPGSGLYLDLRNIKGEDFEEVRVILDALPTVDARMRFMYRLGIEFDPIMDSLFDESKLAGKLPMDQRRAIDNRFHDAMAFLIAYHRENIKLKKVAKLESAGSDPLPLASESKPGRESKFSNAQIALIFYLLLQAAGPPKRFKKTAVAKFLHKLTGANEKNLKIQLKEAEAPREEISKIVADEFDNLGLPEIARKIRNKDFTKME